MKINWSKYIAENNEFNHWAQDEQHLASISDYLDERVDNFKDEIVVISLDMFINKKDLIIELIVFNNSDRIVNDLELEVELNVLGQDHFIGKLTMNKDCFDPLPPNEARIDLVNFKNDIFKKGKYTSNDYSLKVKKCIELVYEEQK
ncbi:hypothetical protein [Carnobacterium maltaromaticum]|uniref:hypothetical protein n=1 Tax=Carnobacterium maltaromaticum TaxID=2751 RepID=UPI001071CDE8|nr:hypothetical protein [Carnobacterium maltaromaticum]TFJ75627.1 hypothetical protein CKN94_05610 [Carnobacterium maltaromaticum]TFJ78794.1 hypothetical protein CKN97_05605 [Carnobacterium maltaromaticum]